MEPSPWIGNWLERWAGAWAGEGPDTPVPPQPTGLSSHAIAVQGIGYSPIMVAVQGLRGAVDEPQEASAGGGWLMRIPKKRSKKRRVEEELFVLLHR